MPTFAFNAPFFRFRFIDNGRTPSLLRGGLGFPGLGNTSGHSHFNGQVPRPPLGSTIDIASQSPLRLLLPNQLAVSALSCWCHMEVRACAGGGLCCIYRTRTPHAHSRGPLIAGSHQNRAVKICYGRTLGRFLKNKTK